MQPITQEMVLLISFSFIFSAIAAFTLGKKRSIGWKWTFVLCFTTFFFVGLGIVLASPKLSKNAPQAVYKATLVNTLLGCFLFIAGIISLSKMLSHFADVKIIELIAVTGIIALGVYALGLDIKWKIFSRKL